MKKRYVAVIQAGGKGTRMISLTQDRIPKPMLLLNCKPMLQWQIENIVEYGIAELVIIIGHLGNKVREYFGNGEQFGIHISYIEESEPLGSAGALYYLNEMYKGFEYLLIFGDVMFQIDWNRMMAFHEEKEAEVTLLAHPNSHPFDSDLLIIDKDCRVIGIDSKDNRRDYWYTNCVNAGIYILSENFVSKITDPEKKDLEKDLLKLHMRIGGVYGYISSEYVKDAGTPERFKAASREQSNGVWEQRCLRKKQKCIFLDRDGTVNKFNGYVNKEEQFELEDNAADAVKMINQSGYLAIVVTNQPVVARGMCNVSDINRIHQKMQVLLGKKGAYLDDIVFCPHHPDKGYLEENPVYKIPCNCRKPATGMIDRMVRKYNIDLEHSYMIGDSTVDIQTGINAGLSTVLVRTGQCGRDENYGVKADMEAEDLLDAVKKILKSRNGVRMT